MFTGKLVAVKRYNTRGCAVGHALLEGFEGNAHQTLRILFQNEYLLAKLSEDGGRSERTLVHTPDIISIHDESTLTPVTTDQLRYGQRCKVFMIPVNKKWSFEGADDLVGLKAFNLEAKFGSAAI